MATPGDRPGDSCGDQMGQYFGATRLLKTHSLQEAMSFPPTTPICQEGTFLENHFLF